MQQQSSSQKDDENRTYARWAGLGFEFVGTLAVFCYMGYKLDAKLNTSPWFLLVFFAVGFIGTFYLILKETSNIRRK